VKKLVLPVEIEVLEEGGYLAVCNAIQGCHAEGDTIADALETLEDVARALLELRKEDGLPPPEGLEELQPDSVIRAQVVVTAPE
jgi:predicted RNase H-like HicB family nuclease